MDQEVLDARAKLAARFGKVQVGGKGKLLSIVSLWRDLGFMEPYIDGNLCFYCDLLYQDHLIYLSFYCRNSKKNQEGCPSL